MDKKDIKIGDKIILLPKSQYYSYYRDKQIINLIVCANYGTYIKCYYNFVEKNGNLRNRDTINLSFGTFELDLKEVDVDEYIKSKKEKYI